MVSDAVVAIENCPRCTRPHAPREEACPRCGLLVERWSAFRPDVDDPPELELLWMECLAAWQDEAIHDRVLLSATNLAALPGLARRYRLRALGDPGDTVAQRRLLRVAVVVESSARAQAEEKIDDGRVYRVIWILGHVVAALGLAIGIYFLVRALSH